MRGKSARAWVRGPILHPGLRGYLLEQLRGAGTGWHAVSRNAPANRPAESERPTNVLVKMSYEERILNALLDHPWKRGMDTLEWTARRANAIREILAPLHAALRDTTRTLGELTGWLLERQWLPPGDPMLVNALDVAARAAAAKAG